MSWPPVALAVLAFASGTEFAWGNALFFAVLGAQAVFWLCYVVFERATQKN